jgi:hypothetical protein
MLLLAIRNFFVSWSYPNPNPEVSIKSVCCTVHVTRNAPGDEIDQGVHLSDYQCCLLRCVTYANFAKALPPRLRPHQAKHCSREHGAIGPGSNMEKAHDPTSYPSACIL